jgi:hypothetical protein
MSRPELCLLALFAVLSLAANTAAAQDFVNPAENAYASATPEDVQAASGDVAPKIVDRVPVEIDDATLSKALSSESFLSSPGTAKPLARPDSLSHSATWNRVDNPDGSSSFSVNKPLALPWDAKVGADISTAPSPSEPSDPRVLPRDLPSNTGAGSAWANVAVPHLATVEVRAEPANDHDTFGTKLERSVPLGKSFSVTAQSSFGVTEMRPLIASATTPSADAAGRLFSTDNSLQLNVVATGTSIAAGASTVTGDPVTHSRFSAGQKIYGPLSVTGTVYDPGEQSRNMSLTAGMNFTW